MTGVRITNPPPRLPFACSPAFSLALTDHRARPPPLAVLSLLQAGGLATGAGAAQHVVGAGGVAKRGRGGRGWATGKWRAYAGSKLCNVLYAAELTKRYGGEESGVVAVAVRPGTVWTGIARHSPLLRVLFALAYPLLTSVEKVSRASRRRSDRARDTRSVGAWS